MIRSERVNEAIVVHFTSQEHNLLFHCVCLLPPTATVPMYVHMSVHVCVLVRVCELGALGCVGRVGWPQKIFNPPAQFSRLGIQVSLAIYVSLSRSWLGWLPFLFSYASVLNTCTSMYSYGIMIRTELKGLTKKSS